ncbi:hypothetical protein L227DRAFT_199249 [Lentinus tigrinus ALCF2SS1-6]|uniref:Uncharacterized protein n=1 Tax=Lentinus tigrinus ALCF2SS1-6 TaxID=1328759 RepID=A0A5C2S322_9APHY|nr:hypothetical protein L227DRAFT_199249 [Lentinus tigrinus ALCF2SS1-6]
MSKMLRLDVCTSYATMSGVARCFEDTDVRLWRACCILGSNADRICQSGSRRRCPPPTYLESRPALNRMTRRAVSRSSLMTASRVCRLTFLLHLLGVMTPGTPWDLPNDLLLPFVIC